MACDNSPQWCAFGGGGDLQVVVLLKKNAASVLVIMLGGGDTHTLLNGKKKFQIYALAGSGDTKTFQFSPALVYHEKGILPKKGGDSSFTVTKLPSSLISLNIGYVSNETNIGVHTGRECLIRTRLIRSST